MSEPEHASLDIRRKRLLYRATHRGTHENDLLIGGFVSARIAALADSDLDALEAVLDFPDIELANWLIGRKPVPPEADCPCCGGSRTPPGRWRGDDGDGLGRAGGLRRPPAGAAAGANSLGRCCTSRATISAWRGSPRRWCSSRRRPSCCAFPAWDCLPYDRVSPNPSLVSERIATLGRLLGKAERPRLVLTTVNALVQRVPPRHAFQGASLRSRSTAHGAAARSWRASWKRTATPAPER